MQQPGYLHQAYPDIVYPHDVESGPHAAPADLSATEQGKEDQARSIPPRSLRSKPWQSECSPPDSALTVGFQWVCTVHESNCSYLRESLFPLVSRSAGKECHWVRELKDALLYPHFKWGCTVHESNCSYLRESLFPLVSRSAGKECHWVRELKDALLYPHFKWGCTVHESNCSYLRESLFPLVSRSAGKECHWVRELKDALLYPHFKWGCTVHESNCLYLWESLFPLVSWSVGERCHWVRELKDALLYPDFCNAQGMQPHSPVHGPSIKLFGPPRITVVCQRPCHCLHAFSCPFCRTSLVCAAGILGCYCYYH